MGAISEMPVEAAAVQELLVFVEGGLDAIRAVVPELADEPIWPTLELEESLTGLRLPRRRLGAIQFGPALVGHSGNITTKRIVRADRDPAKSPPCSSLQRSRTVEPGCGSKQPSPKSIGVLKC